MRGRGTHPRVTPDDWTMSRRVVTSKVRHLALPFASAPRTNGRAKPLVASVVAPAFRNVLLSMAPLQPTRGSLRLPNRIGRDRRVKSVVSMMITHRIG